MRRIILNEYNVVMGPLIYLPNATGMLRAYAEAQPEIRRNYTFAPFSFIRDTPERLINGWGESPSVIGFSSSIWNHELNLDLARRARSRFPEALIVFGGPHVPHDARAFLKKYAFIDVAVAQEGEETFAELLRAFLTTRDFSEVRGLTFRHPRSGECIKTPDRAFTQDMDVLPSPYLQGLYDYLLENRAGRQYQVIFETNRGCPFRCTFCAWGNELTKVRMFSLDRIEAEVAWLGKKQIAYTFGADANFGMFPRDPKIAELFAEGKKRHGYPETFRVCYGKNAEDRVFETALILDGAGLTKGVTLSFQSTDQTTLENIGRGNISLGTYHNLLKRYRAGKIPVYTEIILGLPGETYESFKAGLEEIFAAGLHDQIGIFFCTVLPTTPMADPAYVAKHGIRTRRIELVEFHASKRAPGEVGEYEDVVVETNSMPLEEWKRSATLGWMTQLFHGLKMSFFVGLWLHHRFGVKYTEWFEYALSVGTQERYPVLGAEIRSYGDHLNQLLAGGAQCVFVEEFGVISWQPEEAAFLRLSRNLHAFYGELAMLAREFVQFKEIQVQEPELLEVCRYQCARMAGLTDRPEKHAFFFSVPQYFDALLKDEEAPLEPLPSAEQQVLTVEYTQYDDPAEFARKVVWYGRRDSRTVLPGTWVTLSG